MISDPIGSKPSRDDWSAGMPVAIGIPTYRRPERLEQLLESLRPSLALRSVRLIIADNACDAATAAVVATFAAQHPAIVYLSVAERGISAARNAIIAAFVADTTAPRWLGMLDDDLSVDADWLDRMQTIGEETEADVVAGPYTMADPTGRYVIDQSVFLRRERRPTGPCGPVYAAGNILLFRTLLTSEPVLRFDQAYGLSGGEDYDFFGRAAAAGARFAWCDEAFAVESVDRDRLTSRAVFYRYFSSGNYMAVIDRKNERGRTAWRRHGVALAKAVGIIVSASARLDRERAMQGVFRFLLASGAVSALLGRRLYRYR